MNDIECLKYEICSGFVLVLHVVSEQRLHDSQSVHFPIPTKAYKLLQYKSSYFSTSGVDSKKCGKSNVLFLKESLGLV